MRCSVAATKGASRPIWTGSITFGLVSIPVQLVTAVRESTIHFHMLHDQDHARLVRKMFCSADGKEVHSEHTVKGYEIAKDQYVIVTQEELEAVQAKRSKTIEIQDFVEIGQIDPLYYDRPYYVVPQEAGIKPYRLLVDAMEQAGRVAIARSVMRNKEQLVALRPKEGVLVMETMHFHDEVVPLKDLGSAPKSGQVNEREMKMAQQLIGELAGAFDPTKYEDEYAKAVHEMIQRKAAGEEVVTAPQPAETPGRTANLMEALQASLAKAKARAGNERPPVEEKTSPETPHGKSPGRAKRRK